MAPRPRSAGVFNAKKNQFRSRSLASLSLLNKGVGIMTVDLRAWCGESGSGIGEARARFEKLMAVSQYSSYRYLRIDQQTTAIMIPTLPQGTATDHDGEIPWIGPLPSAIPAMAPAPRKASPAATHTCFPVGLQPSPLIGCSADFLSPDGSSLSIACRPSFT